MSATDPKLLKRQRFEGVFAKIVDELLEYLKAETMPAEAVEWYKRNLDLSLIHI